LGFLYRPQWVLKWNELGRSVLFNDAYVLLYRRRWGLLLFLAAILFFYSGFNNIASSRAQFRPSSYLDLWEAYRVYRGQNFAGAVTRCNELLKREPNNINAWVLLGSSWVSLGRKDMAKQAWEHVLSMDPDHPVKRSMILENPGRMEDPNPN
ncbi:MAG: hypothetical protein HY548_01640, partial [Elusimicrobia bacterium]|nr:hypothetical protein [Elusimicrobiota bacterium]